MDYFKKYLKYKIKYMDLKSQMKYVNVEISDENKLGLVRLGTINQYVISGIQSCIGIIIRSFKEDDSGGVNVLSGLAIHFIDGVDDSAHFINEGITEFGKQVIEKLEMFILENKENNIQLDLITNSIKNKGRHDSTEMMIQKLVELFSLFVDTNNIENFEIKYTLNTGRLEFDPKTWNF